MVATTSTWTELPEEIKMTAQLTRRFVREELHPIEADVDRNDGLEEEQRQALIKKIKDLGLWNLEGAKEWGGGGFSKLGSTVCMEEKGKTSIYLAQFSGIWGGGTPPKGATKYQLDKFFIPAMNGEKRSAAAHTEPGGGSDTRAFKTRAVRDGDNYIINGSKTFITNAQVADHIMVTCITDPGKGRQGFSRIIVERDTPGLTITPQQMLGMRGGKQAELHFQDCVVPAENLIGDEGEGYGEALGGLVMGRLSIAASSVGTAVRCLTMATEYAKTRVAYGGPIANHQGTSFKLADMAVEIAACRALTRQTAWMVDQGHDMRVQCSMAKLFASEMVGRVVDNTIQIYGGYGYSTDLPFERMWRDVRLWRIGEGTSEIQRFVISRGILNHYINLEDAW